MPSATAAGPARLRRDAARAAVIAGATCAAGLWAAGAAAQVNTEPLRKRIKVQGVSAIVEASFTGRTGNTQGVTASGKLGAGFARGPHLVFAFVSGDYERNNHVIDVDKTLAHARYDTELSSRLWWEAFVQAQSDSFERLTLRNLLGTGPRAAVVKDPAIDVFLGASVMLERDVINVQTGALDRRDTVAARANFYLSAHASLGDRIEAVSTTYVQPSLAEAGDLRVLSESGFVFKVTKKLQTSVTFTARYDSRPPSGVLPTDTELKNAVALTL